MESRNKSKKLKRSKSHTKCILQVGEKKVQKNPLTNPYILSSVLQYLGEYQLKICRSVNQLWKEEATRILKQKTTVQFIGVVQKRRNGNLYGRNISVWDRISTYSNEMKHFQHYNFSLSFRKESTFVHNLTRVAKTKKFFTYFGPQMRYFELQIRFKRDTEVFHQIIRNIQYVNHLKLDIAVCFQYDMRALLIPTLELQNVRQFDIKFTDSRRNRHSVRGSSRNELLVGERIAKLAPKAKALIIRGQYRTKILAAYANTNVIKNLRVEDISFGGGLISATLPDIDILSKWSMGLRRLQISLLPEFTDPTVFQNLINRHAPTLEEFYVGIPETRETVNVRMPIFPKLRKFRIYSIDFCDENSRININFKMSPHINFQAHFPLINNMYDCDLPIFKILGHR